MSTGWFTFVSQTTRRDEGRLVSLTIRRTTVAEEHQPVCCDFLEVLTGTVFRASLQGVPARQTDEAHACDAQRALQL